MSDNGSRLFRCIGQPAPVEFVFQNFKREFGERVGIVFELCQFLIAHLGIGIGQTSSFWLGIQKGHTFHRIPRVTPKTERPASCDAGRPVDCLGLTKRWSLYVASTATPGSRRDLTPGGYQS